MRDNPQKERSDGGEEAKYKAKQARTDAWKEAEEEENDDDEEAHGQA